MTPRQDAPHAGIAMRPALRDEALEYFLEACRSGPAHHAKGRIGDKEHSAARFCGLRQTLQDPGPKLRRECAFIDEVDNFRFHAAPQTASFPQIQKQAT